MSQLVLKIDSFGNNKKYVNIFIPMYIYTLSHIDLDNSVLGQYSMGKTVDETVQIILN